MFFTLLLAPLGALAATTTTSILDFDPGAINAAPSPEYTAPPPGAISQSIPYNSASVSSAGAAAATGEEVPLSVVSALASVSIPQSLLVALSDTATDSISQPLVVAPSATATDSVSQPLLLAPSDTATASISSSLPVAAGDTPTATVPNLLAKRVAEPPNRLLRSVDGPEDSDFTIREEIAELEKRLSQEASAAAAPLALAKRGDCSKQPAGWATLTPGLDDVNTFMNYGPYHLTAMSAVTPPGYQRTFRDMNASVSANSYLGLQTMRSYDTVGCSKWCDNTTLCTGFNIFHERDPVQDPGQNCPNPPTIVNYKCTLWGSGVELAAANNFGQWREQYQVVISGSNGYEKTNTTQPITPKGCLKPQRCTRGALRAVNSLLGTKFFPGAFDLNVCVAFAEAQNLLNKKQNRCKLFNAYMIKRDGVAMGIYCGLYSQYYAASSATFQPGRILNRFWGVESSFNVIVISGWGK